MMKNTATIIACCLLLSMNAPAQLSEATISRRTGVQLGMSYTELKEGSLNRAIHTGPGMLAGWYREVRHGNRIRKIELGLGSGFLRTPYEPESSSFLFSAPLNYTYLLKLPFHIPHVAIHLGTSAGMKIDIAYFDNWDQNHYYWFTAYHLGLAGRFTLLRSEKGELQVNTTIPFVLFTSRTPSRFTHTQANPEFMEVAKTIHSDMDFQLPAGHQEINAAIGYTFLKPHHVRPTISWKVSFRKNNTPGAGEFALNTQSLGFGIEF